MKTTFLAILMAFLMNISAAAESRTSEQTLAVERIVQLGPAYFILYFKTISEGIKMTSLQLTSPDKISIYEDVASGQSAWVKYIYINTTNSSNLDRVEIHLTKVTQIETKG